MCDAHVTASTRSSRPSASKPPDAISGSTWCGFAHERIVVGRSTSPQPATSEPSARVTATWTRCVLSTSPFRVTVTSAGSGTRATLQRVDVGEDLKWTDPEWLAETHDWVIESLDRAGLTLMGPIEQPRVRPWATVLRAPGSEGTVWCKGMVPAVAHEPVAISILARAAPDRVPRLLAADRARRLMLTADGGTRLRDLEGPRRRPEAVDGDAARVRPPPAGGRGRGRRAGRAPACPTGGSLSSRARSPSSWRSSGRRAWTSSCRGWRRRARSSRRSGSRRRSSTPTCTTPRCSRGPTATGSSTGATRRSRTRS